MSQETNNILSFDRTNEFLSSKNPEWELTLQQYNFLITQFKREDTNNDLHIDFNELSEVLEGLSDDEFTEEQIKSIMNESDFDHNGTIEFHEFVYLVFNHKDFACILKALNMIESEHKRYTTSKKRGPLSSSAPPPVQLQLSKTSVSSRHNDD